MSEKAPLVRLCPVQQHNISAGCTTSGHIDEWCLQPVCRTLVCALARLTDAPPKEGDASEIGKARASRPRQTIFHMLRGERLYSLVASRLTLALARAVPRKTSTKG